MLFTKENAADMARRSHAPDSARHLRDLEPEIPKITPQDEPARTEYHDARLTRVRVQLNTLDGELELELRRRIPDARRVKELVDAQMRLSEQERILAGRPMPGSRRPAAERSQRRQFTPSPQPVVPPPGPVKDNQANPPLDSSQEPNG